MELKLKAGQFYGTNVASSFCEWISLYRKGVLILTAFSFGSGEAALPARYYAMAKGDFSLAAQVGSISAGAEALVLRWPT